MERDFLELGWAVVDSKTYEPAYVGNGNQWQLAIFRTRKEAKEFMLEPHGLNHHVIKRVGVSLIS